MNYKPQCNSCKYFITTNKTPKAVKPKRYRSFMDSFYKDTGRCTKTYCVKDKKQVYRKNMR